MQNTENHKKRLRKTRTFLDEERETLEIRAKRDKRKKNYKAGQNLALKDKNSGRIKIRSEDA